MPIIENGPNKFFLRNFVRQTFPPKCVCHGLDKSVLNVKKNGGAQEALWKAGRDRVRQVFFSYKKIERTFGEAAFSHRNPLKRSIKKYE